MLSALAALATPLPSPSPTATAAPLPLGPALISNDPCTTLGALVTRPTVTNAVCTVRPGHAIFETGVEMTATAGGGTITAAPQALLRLGTELRGLEFDLELPSYQHASLGGVGFAGVTDSGAGLKYVLGASPKMSYGVQALVTVPTGTSGFSAGGAVQNYALNGSLALGPIFSLSSTLDTSLVASASRAWTTLQPSLYLSAALPTRVPITLLAEIAQFTNATGPASPTRTQYLVGLTLDPTPRLQVDFEYGFSPTATTGRYRYVGIGLSYGR